MNLLTATGLHGNQSSNERQGPRDIVVTQAWSHEKKKTPHVVSNTPQPHSIFLLVTFFRITELSIALHAFMNAWFLKPKV